MLISFPPPPSGFNPSYLAQVLDTIRRTFMTVVGQDEGIRRIILLSPNGTAYDITVSNAGVVTTAVNDGKTRP